MLRFVDCSTHPLLHSILKWNSVTMYRLAKKSFSRKSCAYGDALFFCGELASSMFLILTGECKYMSSNARHLGRNTRTLFRHEWIAEASLWVRDWAHLGDLRASEVSEVVCIDARAFGEVVRGDRQLIPLVIKYVECFVRELNLHEDDSCNDTTCCSPEEADAFCRENVGRFGRLSGRAAVPVHFMRFSQMSEAVSHRSTCTASESARPAPDDE
eukprot:TRINITY_DN48488_c0_g1_i1.p1 TRINITY_DN48488_c0_g1~~TRINITY_DN48488_c0_g1_i1.p1  ORF type:complete len:214 (-),score=28.43 TRINITY_DN48488_c0_g1_i1:258-899(-)